MTKIKLSFLFILFVGVLHAQDVGLPLDLRQHNLTDSNSEILNPAFSVNYGNTHSLGLWTRWQWQTVDADPTTFFLNYTGKLNNSSAIGAGFFQHNTDIYLNTGGVLNYAYQFGLGDRASLTVGVNVYGYQQEFSGNTFEGDPQIELQFFGTTDDFILQMAPGIQFTYDGLNIGFTSENLFDYNFEDKKAHTANDEKIYLGTASYAIPVALGASDSTSVVRPMLYVKSIPGYDTQVGLSAVLATDKFWAQAGYNSFYGVAVGGGGRIMKRFSIGGVVEFGTDSDLKGKDPTFELITAFDFGKYASRKRVKPFKGKEEEEKIEEIVATDKAVETLSKAEALAMKREAKAREKAQRKLRRDSLALAKKESAIAEAEMRDALKRKSDSIDRARQRQEIAAVQIAEQKRKDSIAEAKRSQELAAAQRITDSIQAAKEKERILQLAQQTEEVKPMAGEKYEEVIGEDGLQPGYYLIANVFGTKRYLDAFKADMAKKGLQAKSFLRSKNNLNYVYLGRYDTMGEARKARDSGLNGKYPEKTWIYRVRPE
ncbi:PorP/SprF family type IX secretion system membrane protein [Maribacter polysaccharolyticus]|uniref:PorP/SprF family type IX secretion system membrane protein n=1 Tax=Maribacter polysaccharolyticus TaxID=3020831 RepID=UPI00237F825A|nr:PorP/SprF family type IX secretion system membrane protein [Maribacter polysaccharolyticus]